MRVLMITSEWPTPELPNAVPFVVRQVNFLRQAGVQVDVFHFRGAKNPLNYLRVWRQVRSRLGRNSYDLIHAQWGQSALLALPKRVPLVITFRGSDLQGLVGGEGHYTLAGKVLRVISRWVACLADEVIVVSENLVRHLPKRPYQIIPSGLDLELFRPIPKKEARQQLGLPPDKYLVLFAASTSKPVKRHDLARAAVASLKRELDIELVVTDNAPYALMPSYMSACEALLVTSLHEGSPNVVKEGLACNLPVVSVDVGDVRQRVAAVDGCVICADDRPESIAAGLAQVLREKPQIDGRSAIRDLDEKVLTKRVISVYQKALAKHAARGIVRALDPSSGSAGNGWADHN